ncbi:ATP-binding protein [Rhodococcus qingshengii]|uniref:ATP-binding protein n=1 Tax=Rhodococcus TaxID=1827 RepID=UPI0005A846EA|nr:MULTISPECIES: ATP-binding protein [Rhodococcus]MCD2133341.1 ATP-binding protein [Rhodococcus qingshengii]WNF44038.1 ATP-binding protein [Rhodococcus sp. SG20037]
MTGDWKFEVPTTGSKVLPPDARYMEALSSQGYGFDVAIADLVDNSIDAGAKDVVIHFVREGDRLVSLLVIDDGDGMTEEQLDVAMTVGGRRDYQDQALGMFGTGLKSASLSHASSVTVVSKTRTTRPVGRRWMMSRAVTGFECDIVEHDYAQSLIDRYNGCPIVWNGTVIRWDGVKNFPSAGGGGQTDRYLHRTINKLALHLGLYFHRFLANNAFNITIAVEDVVTGTEYMNFGVVALDPFGYPVSGNPDYPRSFTAQVPSVGEVEFEAHIWVPKSTRDEYKAVGSVMERQGFYFYRHNRLVQGGGWNNFRQPDQHLALARVVIDLPAGSGDAFRLSVKKEGVEMSPEVVAALETATSADGSVFTQYVADAEMVYREARKRSGQTRKPVIGPGKGIDVSVRETIEEELPLLVGEEPISVRWQSLENSVFFEIDRENRAIQLNQFYRAALLGGRRGTLNDAPLVKSLMYLMLHQLFEKEYSGPREKDNLQLWQAVLVSAARAELDRMTEND